MYEVFEHTADLGLRITAASMEELYAEAGLALFSLFTNLNDVQPTVEEQFRIEGDEPELLLFDLLNELLYRFETEGMLFSQIKVALRPAFHGSAKPGLDAIARGEKCDRQRHTLEHEVKAITYHGLQIEQQSASRWQAEVIVDI